MPQPPWKQLVEELKDQGYESVYLDRLRARLDVAQQHAILEKEIIQEMAYALGQSAAKVDHALLELELIERALRAESDPSKLVALAEEHEAKRQQALSLRRDLLIHRVVLGEEDPQVAAVPSDGGVEGEVRVIVVDAERTAQDAFEFRRAHRLAEMPREFERAAACRVGGAIRRADHHHDRRHADTGAQLFDEREAVVVTKVRRAEDRVDRARAEDARLLRRRLGYRNRVLRHGLCRGADRHLLRHGAGPAGRPRRCHLLSDRYACGAPLG